MIVTVTLNPALDLTYAVDALVPHETHRVSAVEARPGGKGLNVASVLHALGEPVLATGLLGGATGAQLAGMLTASGVSADFVRFDGETRRTVTIADGADATGFWEPGPTVPPGAWEAFVAHFRTLVRDETTVVVLSGSLSPGVPPDAYATLTALAFEAGARVILDSSGEALRHGLAAGPDVIKPNRDEFAALVPPDIGCPERIARVRALGAKAVIVSRGAGGLLVLTPDGDWEAMAPRILSGNPTGAGDACVAAVARGLRDGTPWPDLLADAVSVAAAAVATRTAGTVDLDTYRRLRVVATAAPLERR